VRQKRTRTQLAVASLTAGTPPPRMLGQVRSVAAKRSHISDCRLTVWSIYGAKRGETGGNRWHMA